MARDEETKSYFKRKYPLATGAYDLYILFLLKGKEVSNIKGGYSWIIPNKFLISDYAKKSKADLIENNGLIQAIDVSIFNVFNGVGVYPIIILGSKNFKGKFSKLELTHYEDLNKRTFTIQLEQEPFMLFDQLGIKINSGATGFQAQQLKPAIFNVKKGKSIPFAVSGNIDRYEWTNKSVRYMGETYVEAYINNEKDVVAESKWRFWCNPKIVIAGMTKKIEAVYVESPLGIGVGCYGIYDFGGYDPYCLTAVLNSKYMSHYFLTKFKDKHLAGGYLAINKSTIEGLPLVTIPENTQEVLGNLSKKIHKYRLLNHSTSPLEDEIDLIVFRLFNIPFPVVISINPDFPFNEQEYRALKQLE